MFKGISFKRKLQGFAVVQFSLKSHISKDEEKTFISSKFQGLIQTLPTQGRSNMSAILAAHNSPRHGL